MAKQKESENRKRLEAYALPRRIKVLDGSKAEAFKKVLKELNVLHRIQSMGDIGELVRVDAFNFVVDKE